MAVEKEPDSMLLWLLYAARCSAAYTSIICDTGGAEV